MPRISRARDSRLGRRAAGSSFSTSSGSGSDSAPLAKFGQGARRKRKAGRFSTTRRRTRRTSGGGFSGTGGSN